MTNLSTEFTIFKHVCLSVCFSCAAYVLNKSKNRSSSAINAAAEDEEVRLLCGVGKTRGKRNYMEDVDFAIEDIRIKDKIAAAAYGTATPAGLLCLIGDGKWGIGFYF